MKKNLPVTNVERHYPAGERLISETDLRGIVTTANTAFCQVAGFAPEELVGKSHNLVRHPDMAPELFADLWRTLQAGERWTGVIKNRCKNGDHYWVKAFVSPVFQNGQIVRYRSVRKQPTREEIAAAEALNKRLWAGEKGLVDTLGTRKRGRRVGERLGIAGQLALVAGWPVLMVLGVLWAAALQVPTAVLWAASGTGLLLALLFVRLVYGWLTQPLAELTRTLQAFEQGDLGARAELYGRSPAAQMAKILNGALDGVEVALADMGQMLQSLARGEFGRRIVATLPGELELIKTAANRAAEQMESTVAALNAQLSSLAGGHLDVADCVAAAAAEGKFREAQENAAAATGHLAALLREMVASSQAMAEGDLTRPLRTEAAGELALLCRHYNAALASLTETVSMVRTNAGQVAEATAEISGATHEIAVGASTQMSTIGQMTAALQESGQTVAEIAAGTAGASQKACDTVATVSAGRAKMGEMAAAVQAIAAESDRIRAITGVIEAIADRTNLLALNAAIEAARAGESGRGFAVVAAEVGRLAESSARSAKEIADLTQQAAVEVQHAVAKVAVVSADMDRIEAAARESSDLLGRTAAAMEQQRATVERLGEHAVHLSTIAQANAAATEELAASAGELARTAEGTYRAAERFRT